MKRIKKGIALVLLLAFALALAAPAFAAPIDKVLEEKPTDPPLTPKPGDDGTQPVPKPDDDGTQPVPKPDDDGTQPVPKPDDDGNQLTPRPTDPTPAPSEDATVKSVSRVRSGDVIIIDTSASGINVRASRSLRSDGNIIGGLDNGDAVEIIRVRGNWFEINYNGVTAYIHRNGLTRRVTVTG